jgi:transposase
LVWHKRRWYCAEPACPRTLFTEQVPQLPARARITARLREAAGHRVCDAGSTVVQAARDLALSWPTVMAAFRTAGQQVTAAALQPVTVLGIDETRRGRARWKQDPDTGRWEPVADRWHTGFVDAHGIQGLLGQVEGRAPSDVVAWLTTTPRTWREQIRYVAIDMSTSYRAAVRIGLPHATVVVDHFHVVQLANTMLNTVRRRTTATLRGRRGRAVDPEWRARRRLLRNREDLSSEQFAQMWNALIEEGVIGATLLVAWIAKERLRKLLATARTSADRERIGHLRWQFLTWCADSDIPEVRQLAITVDRWWREIEAFIRTGHSNAKSEGINRMIKLTARAAHGFRNPANQPTNAYAHAASPPVEPEDTSTPPNFEDPYFDQGFLASAGRPWSFLILWWECGGSVVGVRWECGRGLGAGTEGRVSTAGFAPSAASGFVEGSGEVGGCPALALVG